MTHPPTHDSLAFGAPCHPVPQDPFIRAFCSAQPSLTNVSGDPLKVPVPTAFLDAFTRAYPVQGEGAQHALWRAISFVQSLRHAMEEDLDDFGLVAEDPATGRCLLDPALLETAAIIPLQIGEVMPWEDVCERAIDLTPREGH